MKSFDLNIERVLEDWDVRHALREVIANALDEQVITKTREVAIYKDQADRWHIRDYGRGLQYEHLTQNENPEKLRHPDLVIGKFGVGLKDALATFDRHKVKVRITSKHGNISMRKAAKHGFDDIRTLHAVIDKPSDPQFIGSDFIFDGINDIEMAAAKEFFLTFSGETPLETTAYGTVLDKGSSLSGRIYISGLRVAEEPNFLLSYNITAVTKAIRKALNRERTNVGRSAYTDRVKAILLACREKRVAILLVNDLKRFETGTLHDELDWLDVQTHACKLLNAHERVIFLTAAELIGAKDMVDHAQADGYAIVTVPESVKKKIRGLKDLQGNAVRDLETYTTEWDQSFQFSFVKGRDLTKPERDIFNRTPALFKLIGGKPKNVKEVLISATMRREAGANHEAVGLWEPTTKRIIIKRDQLRDLRSYASTLLHEAAHARSGASDVSRAFEEELTQLLGTLAGNRL